MPITRPINILTPFASAALAGSINTLPATPSGSNLASWPEGFPPITMNPVGGLPPYGQDFNGVLNNISAGLQWAQAGGAPAYDAGLSASIGGYPKGAVLVLNDGFTFVISTASGNTNNPNTVGLGGTSGWQPFGGTLAGAGSWAPATTGTGTAYVIAASTPITTYYDGMRVCFRVSQASTGPCTLDAGGGARPLLSRRAVALGAGSLWVADTYTAVYSSTISAWLLLERCHTGRWAQNSTGTALTSGCMGLGSSMSFTPTETAVVSVVSTMNWSSTALVSPAIQLIFGVGLPPIYGASGVGYATAGLAYAPQNISGTYLPSVSCTGFAALTAGTPAWFDIIVVSGSGGTVTPYNYSIMVTEF